MKTIFLLLLSTLSFCIAKTQVGVGTLAPHPSSIFELKDTTRGILIPRMKKVNRETISSPAEGLLVYQTDSFVGYWYYTLGLWKPLIETAKQGKHSIILTGNITNQEASLKISNEFGVNTRQIMIVGCTQLTSIEFPLITECPDILITDNALLQSIAFPNLVELTGNFQIYNCPNLVSIGLPELRIFASSEDSESFNISGCAATVLNFPNLKSIFGTLNISKNSYLKTISLASLTYQGAGYINIESNDQLESTSFSSLVTGGHLAFSSLPKLGSVSFPSLVSISKLIIVNDSTITSIQVPLLQTATYIGISSNNAITEISFPLLASVYEGLNITSCKNLKALSIDNFQAFGGKYLSFDDNKLLTGNINYLLRKFVLITPFITGKTISLTQTVSAPPTGQGIIDKATLISRGNTVTTN